MKRIAVFLTFLGWLTFLTPPVWAGNYEDGVSHYGKNNFGQAIGFFMKALEDDPANLDAKKRLGDCYYALGKNAMAISVYREVIQEDPNDGVVRLHLAQVYQWENDSPNAVEQYNELLKIEPENLTALRELAEVYSWDKATYDKSIEACDKILEKDPEDKKTLLISARVRSWMGQHTEAAEVYKQILKGDPNNDDLRLEYAYVLMYAKQYDEATNQFNLLSLKPKYTDRALLGLGEAYTYSQRYADAVLSYRMVLKKDPDNIVALRGIGNAYAAQKRTREAIESYEKAAGLEPANMDTKIILANLYSWEDATYPKAVKACNEILEDDPNNFEARKLLSRIYALSNNTAEAEAQYQAMLEADPENQSIRLEYVRTLRDAGDYERAIHEVDLAISALPQDAEAKLLKANLHAKSGQFEESIDMFKDAMDTDDPAVRMEAQIGLAEAYNLKSVAAKKRKEELSVEIEKQWLGVIDRVRWIFAGIEATMSYNKAVGTLEKSIKEFPGESKPHIKLAEIYTEHRDYENAVVHYNEAIKADSNDISGYLGLSVVYGKMGDHEKSIDAVRRAAAIAPQNMEVIGALGDAYAYQQDVIKAIDTLEKALVLRFSDMDLHRKLAHVYAQDSAYYDKGIQECRYILTQDPEDDTTRLLLARLYSWTERYDESVVEYQTLIAKSPHDEDLYIEMVRTRIYAGHGEQVIGELVDQLNQDPSRTEIRIALAQAYQMEGEYDLAELTYKQVMEIDSRHINAHLGLGDVYRITDQYDKAKLEYREVLAADDKSVGAYYGLGVIDRKSGEYEKAIVMHRKALEIDPNNSNSFTELSYNHYLLSRRYVAVTGDYKSAWWLFSNNWGDIYGVYGEYPANIVQMRGILEDDPGNTDIRFLLAREYEAHNRYKEAVREYRRILDIDPNHTASRLALAEIYAYDKGTYNAAIYECIEILKQDPENFDMRLRLARLYSWTQRFNASIQQYQWLLSRRPGNLDLRAEYAQTLGFAKRYDAAIKQYQVIIAQDPSHIPARMSLAKLFTYNNHIESAMRQYEVVLKQDPNNYDASFALANLYSWDRQYYGRAIDLYRNLYDRYPKNTEARLELGRLLLERGEFAEAEVAYQEAITLEPNNIDAHLALGRVYMGMKKNGLAENEFKAVLDNEPDNVDAHFYLATLLSMNPDRYDDAIVHAEKVVIAEPENSDTRRLLAKLYAYKTQYAKAAEHLQYLVNQDPNDFELKLELARAYNYGEDYDSAIAIYAELAEQQPENTEVRLEVGLCFLAIGQYQDSTVNLEYVAASDPWNVEGRTGLARSYKQSGRVDDAIDQYKRILIINPTNMEAIQYLQLYSIDYTDQALLESFFSSSGAQGGPGGIPPGDASLFASEAEEKYSAQLAAELYNKESYKRARYEFEKLVEANPDNVYYRLALANIYRMSGMWRSAIHQYEVVRQLEPGNQEAEQGLTQVVYDSAPTLDVFAGYSEGIRFDDLVSYIQGGVVGTYRFWEGWEAIAKLQAGRFFQENEETVTNISPTVGLKLGLFNEVSLKGLYTINFYGDAVSHNTANWEGHLGFNLLDVALIDLYLKRTDIRETVSSMREMLYTDAYGGVLTLKKLIGTSWDHFQLFGEYAYRIKSQSIGDTYNLDSQVSNLVTAGLGYTFRQPFQVENSSILASYVFSYIDHEDQTPYQAAVYWAPETFYGHALPITWYHRPTQPFDYSIGVSPSYNIEEGNGGYGFGLFGGMNWRIQPKHILSAAADIGFGLDQDYNYYSYTLFLNYRFIFGTHPDTVQY